MQILKRCKQVLAYANLYVDTIPSRRVRENIAFGITFFNVLNAIIGFYVCYRTYDGLTSIAIPVHFILGNISATAIYHSLLSTRSEIHEIVGRLQSIVDRRK